MFRRKRIRVVAVAAGTLVLAGGGLAAATTTTFRDHQVGSEYANGLQVSDDQALQPLGDRLTTKYGKFMASTVSADGRYLAASSTDKSVVLQIFDLEADKLIYTVGSASFVNQKLTDASVGQESPTYSPDGKFLWLSETNGLTRFPVADNGTLGAAKSFPLPAVGGARPCRASPRTRPTAPPSTSRSTVRTPWWPSTRTAAPCGRPGTSAPPRARSPLSAASSTSATRAGGPRYRGRRP